jgi:predicted RNase H-related nuclease YkuK (DUF458 family)
MKKKNRKRVNDSTFFNLSESDMSFDSVFQHLLNFIKKDPRSSYILAIGTDSQVHQNFTRFTTAIHLYRVGNGAWGCLRNFHVEREIKSLREKVSTETTLSQEVAYMFTPEHLNQLLELLLPYTNEGADLQYQIHLDIGQKGPTREFIQEMVSRVKAMGITPKIKPDSYAASAYADKYTK